MLSSAVGDGYNACEPIAVVGMAMRFPGGSNSSEQFWEMLSTGRSAHTKIPKERFNADGYYHPDSARAGAVSFTYLPMTVQSNQIQDQYQGKLFSI